MKIELATFVALIRHALMRTRGLLAPGSPRRVILGPMLPLRRPRWLRWSRRSTREGVGMSVYGRIAGEDARMPQVTCRTTMPLRHFTSTFGPATYLRPTWRSATCRSRPGTVASSEYAPVWRLVCPPGFSSGSRRRRSSWLSWLLNYARQSPAAPPERGGARCTAVQRDVCVSMVADHRISQIALRAQRSDRLGFLA